MIFSLSRTVSMDTIWLYENGTYIALALVQKTYLGKTLAEVADAQQREKVERIDWEKQESAMSTTVPSTQCASCTATEHTPPV